MRDLYFTTSLPSWKEFKKKKTALACKESRILLQLRPRDKDNYHYQLNCLNRRSDYKGIIGVSKQGLKYYPKDLAFREYLILAYLKTGKRDLAMTQMNQVLKSQPKNLSMLLRLAPSISSSSVMPRASMPAPHNSTSTLRKTDLSISSTF